VKARKQKTQVSLVKQWWRLTSFLFSIHLIMGQCDPASCPWLRCFVFVQKIWSAQL
jgi:hypothetical protein